MLYLGIEKRFRHVYYLYDAQNVFPIHKAGFSIMMWPIFVPTFPLHGCDAAITFGMLSVFFL